MRITAVIMAGGKGERFWPRSRTAYPKQFLSLTSNRKTMIQLTVERISSIVAMEDIFIVTNKDYIALVREQLPDIPVENILAEPVARNTAPCIGYAAAIINRKYDDAVMLVLPSDHLIHNNELYLDTLRNAIDIAQDGENLVTLGITPTYPETGYGYIHFAKDEGKYGRKSGVYKVRRFVEKPSLKIAKEYLASGDYLWNSGMFVWKISTIKLMFEKFLPATYDGLIKLRDSYKTPEYLKVLEEVFTNFASESIDYAIMEKANNIYTLPGNFGWDDVGSWLALERINGADKDGNVILGDVVKYDAKNNIVYGSGKTIAIVGLEDSVVVQTEDAVLICAKNAVNNIKDVVHLLKKQGRENLL